MSDRPIHDGLKSLSKVVRPAILKDARRRKLIDTCFKEFQRTVYPGAPQDQVAALRIAFFAGAAELYAVLSYGTDMETTDATGDDVDLMGGVVEEIELFQHRTIQTALARDKGTRQ